MFCNEIDEKLLTPFRHGIGYYMTNICITILLPYKSYRNNRDIFYDKRVLIFFMNTIAKRHVTW